MKIDLEKELPALVGAGVISGDTAEKIRRHYESSKDANGSNRLFVVFGIIGALLTGLGVILIIAHNWDELPRVVKSFFAFLPLVLGQAFCLYALLKKSDSQAWKESASVFLFFAVGASISLVSQIYNIPGNFSSFVITWMLLCLPLVYVLKSSLVALLYLVGITTYVCEVGYFNYPQKEPYLFWLMLALVLPHYFLLIRNRPKSNFTSFHNWFVPLAVIIALGTVTGEFGDLMFVAYFSLFGFIFSLGSYDKFSSTRLINNGMLVLGSLGSISLLVLLSFDWFWQEMDAELFSKPGVFLSPEFASAILTTLLACIAIWRRKKESGYRTDPKEFIFAAYILLYFVGFGMPYISAFLINILLFVLGVTTINKGIRVNHLGILNYGLLIISALIVSRFFDTNIPFVVRGILFIAVGIGFFAANYWLLQKRKSLTEVK